MDTLFENEHAQLKNKTNLKNQPKLKKDECEEIVK